MPCNGDCNQGRCCNCECKMTKDDLPKCNPADRDEALLPPEKQLPEYKDGDCCTEGCIKCDARKVLAETQEPKPPTILARLPNEATVSNVYEAYEARLKEGKAETQEPVAWLYYHNRMVEPLVLEFEEPDTTKQFESDVTWKKPLYTTPSREWQSLSVEEIEEAVNYLNVKIDYPIMFARLIEMHLKAKNG